MVEKSLLLPEKSGSAGNAARYVSMGNATDASRLLDLGAALQKLLRGVDKPYSHFLLNSKAIQAKNL